MKRILTILAIGLALTITGSLAYASIQYVLNKTVQENVLVGDTTVYSEGLVIELIEHDTYQLTFLDIEETDTQRHYITYTYSYEILVSGMNIEVSSLSSDITVSDLTYTDTTISITFSLNQTMEFEQGDVINVSFYFEAVEQTAVNINTATIDELVSVGFTESEAGEIVALTYNVADLVELYNYIYIFDAITRFESLVNDGTIVFE